MAAPDKFRGTASATELAAAIGRAATACGWSADAVPMADGGEGTLEILGGEPRRTTVAGPLGEPVQAEWRWLPPGTAGAGRTAVIEMAKAAGRALLPHPTGDEPVRADTTGVGELILAAVTAGADRIVVTVGGSATTDGGWGALCAIGDRSRLGEAELVVACDVRTPFLEAARVFGPQKGAYRQQVEQLSRRLEELAERYLAESGVDVRFVEGAGAAGGLAGGLATLGASLVPGFGLVAAMVGLAERIAGADLVVTGEGRLDAASLEGKVVGGVIDLAGGHPVLCLVGQADPSTASQLSAMGAGVTLLSLVEQVGWGRSQADTVAVVEELVGRHLSSNPASAG